MKKMKTTLITLTKGHLENEILQHLKAVEISYNAYITPMNLINTQSYLYGNCGYSMFMVLCSKLDKMTAETINEKYQ